MWFYCSLVRSETMSLLVKEQRRSGDENGFLGLTGDTRRTPLTGHANYPRETSVHCISIETSNPPQNFPFLLNDDNVVLE